MSTLTLHYTQLALTHPAMISFHGGQTLASVTGIETSDCGHQWCEANDHYTGHQTSCYPVSSAIRLRQNLQLRPTECNLHLGRGKPLSSSP